MCYLKPIASIKSILRGSLGAFSIKLSKSSALISVFLPCASSNCEGSSALILFKEALKRIEVLCELITEENIKSQSKTKITPEMISSTNSKLKKESLGKTNNQINTNLPSDSIFDF